MGLGFGSLGSRVGGSGLTSSLASAFRVWGFRPQGSLALAKGMGQRWDRLIMTYDATRRPRKLHEAS